MLSMWKQFREPDNRYRSKPFWSLNGDLEDKELRRQISVFNEMGFGGFFMHSRVGLLTEYLSPIWFELIGDCVDEAASRGMEAWLYDEDRWPSGAAGGIITKDTKYRMKQLKLVITDKQNMPRSCNDTEYVFSVKFSEGRILSYRRIYDLQKAKVADSEKVLIFTVEPMKAMSWFNGGGYLDTLNREAVSEFIRKTHEKYKEAMGSHFGKTIPGIFTDEPMHGAVFRDLWEFGMSLPWTQTLPRSFSDMFGYDITEHLPELVFDNSDGSFSKARYHYHRCKTKMFVEAFSKQISQWCQKNDLLFTGHVLLEEPVSSNASVVGSCMQFYEHMHAPGIDNLTQYWKHYLTAKQCVSVARQNGRKWVLSELYGCTGWETTFETYKYIGDWQAALGITLRCPHLSHYTLAGEAKRDYPASIHFHTPWWREYRVIEDYFARLNVLLTEGEPICSLAVLHPLESATLLLNSDTFNSKENQSSGSSNSIGDVDKSIDDLTNILIGQHLDFDFLDEQLIENMSARVEIMPDGPVFRVGRMRYSAIVVPKMLTIRSNVLEALKKFIDAGGRVVFIEEVPRTIEGQCADIKKILGPVEIIAQEKTEILRALKDNVTRVSIVNDQGVEDSDIIYQLRRDNLGYILFLVNTNRTQSKSNITVTFQTEENDIQQVQWWDPFTGSIYDYPADAIGGQTVLNLNMPSTGSALLRLVSQRDDLPRYCKASKTVATKKIDIDPNESQLSDVNVFLMDTADISAVTDKGKNLSASNMEIIQVDEWLRNELGLPQRGNTMVQPWASRDESLGRTASIKLTYKFEINDEFRNDVCLAIEQPDRWSLRLNDTLIDNSKVDSWWVDPAIKKITIPKETFRQSQNQLVIEGQFDRFTDLEIVYILGLFGVSQKQGTFVITKESKCIDLGTWSSQGLPFYAGHVTYTAKETLHKKSKNRYLLSFGRYAATAIEVTVNGCPMPIVFYGDHCVDVTEALKDGENLFQIRLLGSLRNAFGPLHISTEYPQWVGPDSYRASNPLWQEEYRIKDYGLLESPQLIEVANG